ncbi:MAG: superoxide dismutase [Fe], partial [Syntrophales bacterium]|nr:superoxide dismutase [Fe] [Syntrophales bacterium]
PPEALAPIISARTLEFHHGKHHKAYVDNANNLIAGTEWENMEPEEIIVQTAGDPARVGIFNNVAQAWNHAFYWRSLKPGGGGKPTGPVAALIDGVWGGYDSFVAALKQAG